MKSVYTIALIILLNQTAFSAVKSENISLHFEHDSDALTEEVIQQLDDFVSELDVTLDFLIQLNGHTDHDGSLAYNLALSERRSHAVESYLLSKGLNPEQIQIRSHGELQPAVANNSEESKFQNRRVTLEYTLYQFEGLEEVLSMLRERNRNQFELDASQPHTIRTAMGIEIEIPAASFVDSNGNEVSGKVHMEVTDALDPMSWISEGLSTRAGEDPLQSGGMVKVEARAADGSLLQMAEGQELTVTIPTDVVQEDMQLYVSDKGDDWKTTPEPTFDYATFEPYVIDKPRRNFAHFKAANYVSDVKSMPRKPTDPVMPKKPNKPDPERFEAEYKWFDLKKEQKAELKRKALERAQVKYESDMVKYERKVSSYHKRCAAYHEINNQYYVDLAQWHVNDSLAEIHHHEVLVPQAQLVYQKALSKKEEAFQKRMDAYHEHLAMCEEERSEMQAKRVEAYAAFQKKHAEWVALQLTDLNSDSFKYLSGYVFKSEKMGWLNCDRLQRIEEESKQEVIVQSNGGQENLYVVENNGSTIFKINPFDRGKYGTTLDKNQDSVVFGYKLVDGQLYSTSTPVKGRTEVYVNYQPITFVQLKDKLHSLKS